jgi:DnaJ-class molecular chaperone
MKVRKGHNDLVRETKIHKVEKKDADIPKLCTGCYGIGKIFYADHERICPTCDGEGIL